MHLNHEQISCILLVNSDACPFSSAEDSMANECSKCHGTGKCQVCKGTGHFGYPGYGPVDRYPNHCNACQDSGVCPSCHGSGQR